MLKMRTAVTMKAEGGGTLTVLLKVQAINFIYIVGLSRGNPQCHCNTPYTWTVVNNKPPPSHIHIHPLFFFLLLHYIFFFVLLLFFFSILSMSILLARLLNAKIDPVVTMSLSFPTCLQPSPLYIFIVLYIHKTFASSFHPSKLLMCVIRCLLLFFFFTMYFSTEIFILFSVNFFLLLFVIGDTPFSGCLQR